MSDFLDFAGFKRSARPNNFLLAPPDLCATSKPDTDSPLIELPPNEAFNRLVDIVQSEKLWKKLRTDKDGLKLRFVALTPLLRFKDDVDIQVLSGEDGKTSRVAIYSRSRVGYSDLGKNASRVRDLVTRLTAK